ncbi:MAG TPA: UdgX family uracil-DNA binding protein [Methylovirgula sp.]|nr:UdgX family uracil-DNA binding protein [Methylovirgula sp.]
MSPRQATARRAGKGNAAKELREIAHEAASCERCPLYRDATQTIFGEGPVGALIMLVGEQPGDQEDRQGRPFVGPAGRILDSALAEVGLDRASAYVTNAVKHFKHEQRGKRRLHKHPNRGEVTACRWWLDRELALVDPKLILALGTTAAHALLNRPIVLGQNRGRVIGLENGRRVMATIHPSAVLRMRDDAARHQAFAEFVADLREAVRIART